MNYSKRIHSIRIPCKTRILHPLIKPAHYTNKKKKKKKKLTHIESFPSNISLFSTGADLKPAKTHKKKKKKNYTHKPRKLRSNFRPKISSRVTKAWLAWAVTVSSWGFAVSPTPIATHVAPQPSSSRTSYHNAVDHPPPRRQPTATNILHREVFSTILSGCCVSKKREREYRKR